MAAEIPLPLPFLCIFMRTSVQNYEQVYENKTAKSSDNAEYGVKCKINRLEMNFPACFTLVTRTGIEPMLPP